MHMWVKVAPGMGYWCDEFTVTSLQGLAPRLCLHDRSTVLDLFEKKLVFPKADEQSRKECLKRILEIPGKILTFDTFYRDANNIGPAMLSLRTLSPLHKGHPKSGEPCTLKSALEDSFYQYYGRRVFPFQRGNNMYTGISLPRHTAVRLAYIQLCLGAIRHHKNYPIREATIAQLNGSSCVVRLAYMAHQFGFLSEKINELKSVNPDMCDISRNMLQERPDCLFSITADDFNAESRLRHERQAIFKPRAPPPPPRISIRSEDTGSSLAGDDLFLPLIWDALMWEPESFLTPFGRLVLVLEAFFDVLGDDEVKSEVLGCLTLVDQSTQPEQNEQSQPEPDQSTHYIDVEMTNVKMPNQNVSRVAFWLLRRENPTEKVGTCPTELNTIESEWKRIDKNNEMTFMICNPKVLKVIRNSEDIDLHSKCSTLPRFDVYCCYKDEGRFIVGKRLDKNRRVINTKSKKIKTDK